jgi:hypothetical protein
MFRETDLSMLFRGLQLLPWQGTAAERDVGAYLALLTCVYALPLWIDALWTEWIRPRLRAADSSVDVAPIRPFDSAQGGPAFDASPLSIGTRALLAGGALALILVFRSQQSLDFIYFQF